ncbi:THO complex subunit 2, partial [Quaeritorhiza haematococci]
MFFVTRRLSKENVKQYGRHIGKVVHSNPTIAFSLIIDQIQSYDNQIPHVVDASRYLTDLEFDILSYIMIEALAKDENRDRIKPDGTTLSKWLVSLATFAGTLFRKHPIELQGVLQYVFNQVAKGNLYDLVVLQELVAQMSGIRILEETTEAQLDATGGGDMLKRESLLFESLRLVRKPSARLIKALQDTSLLLPLGILIAQKRKSCIFENSKSPDLGYIPQELKILSW